MSSPVGDGAFVPSTRRIGVKNARRTKTSLACNYCRSKKIKCNGSSPCTNCIDQKALCSYPAGQRQRSRVNSKDFKDLEARLTMLETLLPTALPQSLSPSLQELGQSSEHDSGVSRSAEVTRSDSHIMTDELNQKDQNTNQTSMEMENQRSNTSASLEPLADSQATISGVVARRRSRDNDISPPSGDEITLEDDGSNSLPPEEEVSYEYHGPGSYISICSKSGVQWVQEKTGTMAFAKLARCLTSNISRLLKLEKPLPATIEPEPNIEHALEYTRAFFEDCPDSAFGLIRRPIFEARLRAHFMSRHSSTLEDEPAWYALRMAVYAFGCRAIHTRDHPRDFRWAQGPGWQYFQNALSVHSQVLFSRTGLMAVQALAMMSFYVEGIGTPALDYMLCSSAMKLAESKGLHRQPAAAWNLSTFDVQTRSCIWWAIYEYERHIAYRSGRPPGIDDESITCQLPSQLLEGNNVNLDMFIDFVKHAQISSQIIKGTTTLKVSSPTLEEVVRTMTDLEQKLQGWRDSLPFFTRFETATGLPKLRPGVHENHVLYQIYSYYGSLISIHSILVHPWNRISLRADLNQKDELSKYIAKSGEIVASASRKMIEYLRHITIDATTPKWLAFCFPLTALINLFIYVLQHPTLSSVESDIGLMHIAAGHFNYLEFICPEMSFSLTRDLANLARLAVMKAKDRHIREDNVIESPATPNATSSSTVMGSDMGIMPMYDIFPAVDFNDEEWGTLLGWPAGTISPVDVLQRPDFTSGTYY